MANFYVGQRVRIVGATLFRFQKYIGVETVITGPAFEWRSANERVICYPIEAYECGCAVENLSPLTDPSADRFIESIKKLGREPINDAPKVTITK